MPRIALVVRIRPGLGAATLVLLSATALQAQYAPVGPYQPGVRQEGGRLLDPPRGTLQTVRDAELAIGQRNYGEAVMVLGELLRRDDRQLAAAAGAPPQDYFLPRALVPAAIDGVPGDASVLPGRAMGQSEGAQRGPVTLVEEVRRVLSSMPREGLETYELQYGAQARQRLDQAASTADWDAVAAVRRSYFHTKAGLDATALMAQRAVVRGRTIEAERLLTSLRTHWALTTKDAVEVDVLLHGVQRLNGTAVRQPLRQPTESDEATVETPARRPTVEFRFLGEPVTIAEFRIPGTPPLVAIENDPLDRWLSEPFAAVRQRFSKGAERDVLSPIAFGQEAAAEGQLPLSMPRWTVRATSKLMEERLLGESQQAMVAAGAAVPPSAMPLKVGNQLLMRGTDRLSGIDFQTGKLIWQYPWSDSEAEQSSIAPDRGLLQLSGQLQPDGNSEQSFLQQRAWSDAPYGRFSSDGQRVFLLADLPRVEELSYNAWMGVQQGITTLPTNSLLALDLATEGKLVWRIGGGVHGKDDWSETFFLGAPLVIDDALYLIAEIASDIYLVCLEADSGRQRWRQQLLAVEASRLSLDAIRRIGGATPSYHQGLLVCPTGAGMIVAVDLADRSLVWSTPVIRDETLAPAMGRREILGPEQYQQRWWDGTAQIVGNTVYVTPVESNQLYALDLMTGKPRFSGIQRVFGGDSVLSGALRYLAGVWGDTVVLVGNDLVQAFDAHSGAVRWMTSDLLEIGEIVSGVGIYGTAEDEQGAMVPAYFLPTSNQRIVVIALDDGRLLATRELQFPAGNLVAVGGQIVSQSPIGVAVAYGQRALEPMVEAALSSNPDDFDAIVRQAELSLQKGELQQALQWLIQARKLKPEENAAVENLSVKAMLSLLESDYQANLELLEPLQTMIYWPVDRVHLLCLQVQALLEQGEPVSAFERLQELSSLLVQEPALARMERSESRDSGWQVSMDTWVSARVEQAWERADARQRGQISELLEPQVVDFQQGGESTLPRWFQHFGRIAGAEEAGRRLAKRYQLDREHLLRSERVILRMLDTTRPGDAEMADWQRSMLQSIYESGGMVADAASLIDPDAVSSPFVRPDPPLAEYYARRLTVNWGKYFSQHMMPEYSRVRASSTRGVTGRIRQIQGVSLMGWQLVSEPSSPFGLRDPQGVVHPIALNTRLARRDELVRQVSISGGMMIAMLPHEMVGINAFDVVRGNMNATVWRRPWRSGGNGAGLRPRSQATRFGDQSYRFMLSGVADGGRVHEVSLGPIDSDQFYLLQGHELIAYDLLTAEPRWRTTDTPSSGVILMRGNQLAVVSPHHHEIALFDKRDGRRLATQPFGDFQLWAATDESLLVYQDDAAGRRTLTLWDPFTGQSLLTHTFTDLSPTNGVFGRIVLSRYAVTLSTRGNLLIWDLQQAKQIALAELGEIPNLHGLNVLLRPESLVVLPTAGTPAERGGAAVQNTSGQDHVQVDHLIANVSLSDGQLLWNHSLENESWGCTLSQATASPLLVLSRGNNYYQTTNSRTRTVDIKAIDLRDGQAQQSLGLPVESIGNEIETTLMVQAHEQLVAVAVGNSLRLEYRFSDTPAETPAVPLPAADAIDVGPAAAAGRDLMDDLFVPLDSGDLFGPPEPLSDPPPTER